ncbi:hypothetical protein MLD38_001803 [Melastoma candidum]|uniref:Uncharacterized protein n=1 Tax=Melastoma candidum TaxID=119954 RepID=A0ACB9SEB0_9MYRT|nr:hypothetical protein MLD38_001803 [Melastoma candidum]
MEERSPAAETPAVAAKQIPFLALPLYQLEYPWLKLVIPCGQGQLPASYHPLKLIGYHPHKKVVAAESYPQSVGTLFSSVGSCSSFPKEIKGGIPKLVHPITSRKANTAAMSKKKERIPQELQK